MDNLITCVKCHETKPLTDFRKVKAIKSGHRGHCKSCEAAASKVYNAANREDIAAKQKAYKEANRQEIAVNKKAWKKANPEKVVASSQIYYEAHREGIAFKQKVYYEANREETATKTRAWRAANPDSRRNSQLKRRALKRGNGTLKVTAKDLKRMLAKPCAYCGSPAEHIDHVVPLSRGGGHSIGNLVGACAPCNLSKGAKFITEWKKPRLLNPTSLAW